MNLLLAEFLSILLLFCAFAMLGVRNVFALIILLSVYSGILACLFSLLGAVDVSFTEAVVGSSISTVLLVALLRRVDPQQLSYQSRPQKLMAAFLSLAIAAIFLFIVHEMPAFGDPTAPANLHVAPEYIARSLNDMKTPNVVTAILADYRGFDTLIETAVVLTAAIGCALILRKET